MGRTLTAPSVVVGIALALLVASFVALSGSVPATRPAAPTNVPAPLSALDSAIVAEVAHANGLPNSQISGILSWLSGLTPTQRDLLSSIHSHPRALTQADLSALGITTEGFVWACAGATVNGAVAGLTLGGFFGAVMNGYGAYYTCAEMNQALTAQYQAWAQGVVASFGNEENLTWGSVGASGMLSILNTTQVGWDRAADNAAILQLGNATFSVPEDLSASEVASQVDEIAYGVAGTSVEAILPLISAFNGHAASGAIYGSVGATMSTETTTGTAMSSFAAVTTGASVASAGEPIVGTGGNQVVYVPNGALLSAASGTALDFQAVDAPTVWYNYTTSTATSGTGNATFAGPTGAYAISTAASHTFWLPNGGLIPTGASGAAADLGNTQSAACGESGITTHNYGSIYDGGSGSVCAIDAEQIALTDTAYVRPFPNGVSENWGSYLGSIEYAAALNGEAYWSFLRASGWTSASQIPANCYVPEPYLTFPSQLRGVALTLNESLSLYEAALQGMAHFYNTSVTNATRFCGSSPQRGFSIGSAVWSNLLVNATGYVYLSNGTGPVSPSGAALPSESFHNLSTWALRAQQLLLMPTIKTVSIPVGVRWAVPANDPVELYAIQAGYDLWLTGNGTGNATGCAFGSGGFCPAIVPLGAIVPGDSIYLTSCTIGGAASANCTVTVSTVNVTVQNLTCPGPCKAGSSPGGGLFGFWNPFAALSAWLAGLFSGLGPFGAWLAAILPDVILLLLILGGAYLIWVFLPSGRRSDGGETEER